MYFKKIFYFWFALIFLGYIFFFILSSKILAVTLFSTDFESADISSWSSSGGGTIATISSELAKSGSYSIKVQHEKTSSYGFQTPVSNIEGGMFYNVSGYGRTTSENTASFFIRVAWYTSTDGSGSQLSSPNDSNSGTGIDSNWLFLTTNVIQAPANANSAKIRLVLTSKTSGQQAFAYFDEVLFQESIAPTSTPTPTTTPTSVPTSVPTSTPIPTTAKTPTPAKIPTPTAIFSITQTKLNTPTLPEKILGEGTMEARLTSTLNNKLTPTKKVEVLSENSQSNKSRFFFSLGAIFLIACGILVFRKLKITHFTKRES